MAKEKAPAFQFYPKEFLMDGNVAGMSLAERGAYITLICLCWQEGSIPADSTRLSRMLGVPGSVFQKLWPALEPCFREAEGRWIHPRLEKERDKQESYRRRQGDNGRLGGRPRKPDETQTKAVGFENESQTEAKKSSPISYLHITPKPPSGALEDEETETRIREFFEQYPAIYREVKGAHYQPKEARDWPTVKELVVQWPDMKRLMDMAKLFLMKENWAPKNVPGTVGQFKHMAPECDSLLRKHGR